MSEKIRIDYADIPWKSIAGTRDKLIHDYFGVNIDILWHIVKEEISGILSKIKIIHQEMTKDKS